jgi:hypothetical protein
MIKSICQAEVQVRKSRFTASEGWRRTYVFWCKEKSLPIEFLVLCLFRSPLFFLLLWLYHAGHLNVVLAFTEPHRADCGVLPGVYLRPGNALLPSLSRTNVESFVMGIRPIMDFVMRGACDLYGSQWWRCGRREREVSSFRLWDWQSHIRVIAGRTNRDATTGCYLRRWRGRSTLALGVLEPINVFSLVHE